ncbi:MAG: von Willebrand factor type, partial [Myxococcales bacterium]|nr:von Willebrand factor type [Myxococcales bacterium]
MTFLGAPLSVVGPALAAGAAALVALYLLKLRRRRLEVPFAELWKRVLSESQSTALWKKLRRLISLAVQLVVLALILTAILDPRLSATQHGRSIAIVVDTSASMRATDGGSGGKTRLDAARAEARRIIAGLAGDDEAMIVAMDTRPAPVGGFTRDDRALVRDVEALAATDTSADLLRALRLCGDALRGRQRPTLVLIGDGAWNQSDLDDGAKALAGVDLRRVAVGKSSDNVGVTAFAVRRYQANQTAYEVLVEVQSFRTTPSLVTLQLVQDGEVVETQKLALAAGERVQRLYPDLAGAGARLEARLTDAHDALALDDVAYAVLPLKHKQKVLLVSGGDLFLEGALLLDENLEVDKVAPAKYDAAATAKYDAVILDGVTPDERPRTHALYLDPHGAHSPFPIRGSADGPLVTETAAQHPLMRWVALKDLNIARASVFTPQAGDVAVASSFKQPIIVARDQAGRKTVALGFDLRRSDLPLRVAFPVLLINALDWFAGADVGLVTSYATGRPWRLPVPAGATELWVRAPDGSRTRAPVHDGRASYDATRTGFYELESAGVP